MRKYKKNLEDKKNLKSRQNERIDLSNNLPFKNYMGNLKKFYARDSETLSYSYDFLNLVSLEYLKDKNTVLENLSKINNLIKIISLRYSHKTDAFDDKSVSTLYGLRYMDYNINIDGFVKTLNKRVKLDSYSGIALSNALTGLQNFQDLDVVANYIDILTNLVINGKIKVRDFSDDIISLVRSFSLSGLEVPENLRKIYEKGKQDFEGDLNSPAEIFCFNLLKSKGIEFDSNVFMDGIEMDFFIKEKDLNIEIDGPQHLNFENKFNDNKRDEYLLEKGINTIRISTLSRMQKFINSNLS